MVKRAYQHVKLDTLRTHATQRLLYTGPAFVLLAWMLAALPILPLTVLLAIVATAILFLRWPWLIWPGIAVALPVTSGIKAGPLSLTDLALACAIGLWLLDGVRRRSLAVHGSAMAAALLCYLAALALSMLQAVHLGEAAVEVIKWVEFLTVLILVRSMVPVDKAPWLVFALLTGGIGQAVLGLYQFIFHIGPESFMILDRFLRASGSFRQPNPYAGYLGLTLPVAASLALWSWGEALSRFARLRPPYRIGEVRRPGGWRLDLRAVAYTTATGLIGAGLLASWSRGGWLGAVAALAAVVVMRSRRAFVAGVLVLVISLGMLLAGLFTPATATPAVIDRLRDIPTFLGFTDVLSQPVTDENFSVIERVAHWVAALRMWAQAPWLGVGPGNYPIVYPDVQLPGWMDPLGHAHNIYLNALGETGLVGLATFLLFWGVCLVYVGRQSGQMQKQAARWWHALAIGVSGVLVHLSVHNFFDNLFVQGIYLHIALWLAILLLYDVPKEARQTHAMYAAAEAST